MVACTELVAEGCKMVSSAKKKQTRVSRPTKEM